MEEVRRRLSQAGFDAKSLDVLIDLDGKPVYRFTHPGGKPAISAWRKLRELVPQSGHFPVLLGPPQDVARRQDFGEVTPECVAETLAYARGLDGRSALERRRHNQFDDFTEGEDPSDFLAGEGEWSDVVVEPHSFITPFDIRTRKPHPEVAFALVPTTHPWDVPAYLGLGSWNDCPEAAVHCAVLRYWHEKHGAEIVAATHDVIECAVSRPPESREEALALAREQYIYCSDIVDQGVETISALAATLLHGSAWYFWWD